MKTPSMETLVQTFRITTSDAKLIRDLGRECSDETSLRELIEEHCPKTYAYALSCYNDPFNSQMWRTTLVLHAIDVIIGTCGVESLGPPDYGDGYAPPYEYLNAGDTYSATLIYKLATDALSVGCWGDIAERHPEWRW